MVLPEEAGIGAAPHRWAKVASERSRWGLSPAVTSSWPGGVDPDPGQDDQARGSRGDQRPEVAVELVEFALELLPAPGQDPQGGLGGGCWAGQGPGPHGRTEPNQGFGLESEQRLAELLGGAAHHSVQLLRGCHPSLHGAAAGHPWAT
jgi:hypothetical protein